MGHRPRLSPVLVLVVAVVAVVAAFGSAVIAIRSEGRATAPRHPNARPRSAAEATDGAAPGAPSASRPSAADAAAPRRRVHVAPASVAESDVSAEAAVLTKEAFLAGYRMAFRRTAGRAPSAAQEDAAWERARSTIRAVPGSYGAGDGRIDADNRVDVEIGERDDIMTFVADRDRWGELRALRGDPEKLMGLFAHRVSGPQVDAPARLREHADIVADGTTLVFGAGKHTVSWDAIGADGSKAPRDLTIQGAGMDATLIRLSDFSTSDVLWNLHIRDCTIDCGNDGAFDLRREKASVFAERVRFVRFDAGHGGCYLLSCNQGAAFYAKSCVFAGGYGRSPGNGSLLRSVTLARFEDCTFERCDYSVLRGYNSVRAAAFVRCLFRDCPADIAMLDSPSASAVPADLLLQDCRTEWTLPEGSRDGRGRSLERSLSELFP